MLLLFCFIFQVFICKLLCMYSERELWINLNVGIKNDIVPQGFFSFEYSLDLLVKVK